VTLFRWTWPRLVSAIWTRRRQLRSTRWGAAVACIAMIAVASGAKIGIPVSAQAAILSPPADAPIMRPGQQVQVPFGSIEIRTFNRSERDGDSFFGIEFLLVNQSREGITINLRDYVRLIADGVPRAPAEASGNIYGVTVRMESAEYCTTKFRVPQRPNVVHILFGTGDEPHIFLRWPE
jgi:hypothetical protein